MSLDVILWEFSLRGSMSENRLFSKKSKSRRTLSPLTPELDSHIKVRYFPSTKTAISPPVRKKIPKKRSNESIIHSLKDKNKKLLCEVQKYKKAIKLLRETERQLKEQSDIQQKLIDIIPIPVYYKDLSGRYECYNEEFARIMDISMDEIKGKTTLDFNFNKSEIATKVKNSDKMLLNGINKTNDDFCIDVRGEKRLFLNNKTLLYDSKEKPLYIAGTFLDVTELKRAEEKLCETEKKLELILDIMKETVMYLDNEMKIIWTNFKMSDKNPEKNKCHNIFINSDKPCKNCPSLKTRKTGKSETALVEYNNKIFEVFSYPVKNTAGFISGTVEVAIDVTDRESARKYAESQKEQMINAEKMVSLGILVAETAHEINNPVNFIKINSSIIKQVWECIRPILNEYFARNKDYVIAGIPSEHIEKTMKDLINGVDDGTERIRNIVESLKNYSRNKPLDMSGAFNINFAVQKSIVLLNSLIKKSTNRFYTEYASNLPDVRGDIRRIEQVIINIIQNACHSLSDKDKAINLKTFMENNKVVILLNDEGIGIPPQNINRVTDPFFTTRDKEGGLGLGLSISKNIIESHNGGITISSDAKNGTSVKIVLPAAI